MMGNIQWHHYDYTKPYEATALYKECHKIANGHHDKTYDDKLGEYRQNEVLTL